MNQIQDMMKIDILCSYFIINKLLFFFDLFAKYLNLKIVDYLKYP